MTEFKVAIVGAGLAGLTCGSILAKSGLNVTIFDKGRFPGGRLASRERDANTFDYGAQYFTARDSRFQEFLTPIMRQGKVLRWSGRFGKMVNGDLQEDLVTEVRYVGVPMMRALADELATGLHCYLLHRITIATRQGARWLLMATVQNEHLQESIAYDEYDFLVLNLPPQQAALQPHASLSEVRFLPCCALLLSFQERLQLDFDGIKLDDRVISWAARDSSKPGPAIWARGGSFMLPPSGRRNILTTNAPELEKLLMNRFSTIFGIGLPATNFVKLHRWRFAMPASNSELGCIVDQDSEIAYCGDWCLTARVEGAFLSGLATANEILNSKAR